MNAEKVWHIYDITKHKHNVLWKWFYTNNDGWLSCFVQVSIARIICANTPDLISQDVLKPSLANRINRQICQICNNYPTKVWFNTNSPISTIPRLVKRTQPNRMQSSLHRIYHQIILMIFFTSNKHRVNLFFTLKFDWVHQFDLSSGLFCNLSPIPRMKRRSCLSVRLYEFIVYHSLQFTRIIYSFWCIQVAL